MSDQPDLPTAIATTLETELRCEIAAAQAKVNGNNGQYWMGARDAYQTVLSIIIPTAKGQGSV